MEGAHTENFIGKHLFHSNAIGYRDIFKTTKYYYITVLAFYYENKQFKNNMLLFPSMKRVHIHYLKLEIITKNTTIS